MPTPNFEQAEAKHTEAYIAQRLAARKLTEVSRTYDVDDDGNLVVNVVGRAAVPIDHIDVTFTLPPRDGWDTEV